MLRGAVAALLVLAATPAAAQTTTVALTAGTLGVGPEVAHRFSDTLGVRANATFLKVDVDVDSDDLSYDGRARLKSAGVMLDVFPFGGGFRISGGARLNRNDGRVIATPTASQRVGNTTYTPAQIGTIRGDLDTKNFAPQLTLGWAGRNQTGFIFGVEAGALFQGKVRVGPLTNSTGLIRQADLDAERADIQDDVDDYKVYPILQLTLGYRF